MRAARLSSGGSRGGGGDVFLHLQLGIFSNESG